MHRSGYQQGLGCFRLSAFSCSDARRVKGATASKVLARDEFALPEVILTGGEEGVATGAKDLGRHVQIWTARAQEGAVTALLSPAWLLPLGVRAGRSCVAHGLKGGDLQSSWDAHRERRQETKPMGLQT